MKSHSVVLEAPRQLRIKEFDVPEIDEGDMLLKVEMVSICGTDPALFAGKLPNIPYPLIPGHEVVGCVAKIGDEASKRYGVNQSDRVTVEPYILCGKCWYCLNSAYSLCRTRRCYGFTISANTPPHLWGAYGEYMYVAPGSRVHRISEDVAAEAACLSSVVGNGIRWTRTKGQLKLGENIVVVGPGAQGLATVLSAAASGADHIIVLGLPRDAHRLALAKEFGATHTIEVDHQDLPGSIKEILGGELADVVVECTGNPSAVKQALSLVKPLGRLVLVGLAGGKEIGLVTDHVIMNEITIVGGLGQSWDVEAAVKLINSARFPVEKMITHLFEMAAAEEALKFCLDPTSDFIKVALKP